jgi:hypothetical protein
VPTHDGSMLLQKWLREGVSVTVTELSLCPVGMSSRGESTTTSSIRFTTETLQSLASMQKRTALTDLLGSVDSAEPTSRFVQEYMDLSIRSMLFASMAVMKPSSLPLVTHVVP